MAAATGYQHAPLADSLVESTTAVSHSVCVCCALDRRMSLFHSFSLSFSPPPSLFLYLYFSRSLPLFFSLFLSRSHFYSFSPPFQPYATLSRNFSRRHTHCIITRAILQLDANIIL